MLLSINKSELKVSVPACPHGESESAACFHVGASGCIVKHFVSVYGLDVNIGSTDASPNMEIAWAREGSEWDIDLANLYIIPVSDPTFSDWLAAQSPPK